LKISKKKKTNFFKKKKNTFIDFKALEVFIQ